MRRPGHIPARARSESDAEPRRHSFSAYEAAHQQKLRYKSNQEPASKNKSWLIEPFVAKAMIGGK